RESEVARSAGDLAGGLARALGRGVLALRDLRAERLPRLRRLALDALRILLEAGELALVPGAELDGRVDALEDILFAPPEERLADALAALLPAALDPLEGATERFGLLRPLLRPRVEGAHEGLVRGLEVRALAERRRAARDRGMEEVRAEAEATVIEDVVVR